MNVFQSPVNDSQWMTGKELLEEMTVVKTLH